MALANGAALFDELTPELTLIQFMPEALSLFANAIQSHSGGEAVAEVIHDDNACKNY
ncbi:MAG: hypothetical protein V4440_14750 [Pseudomonadota bacterium]